MEVASPLTFGRVKAGSKRRFACAPLDAPVAMDASMDDSAFQGQNFKRRRFDNGEREINVGHSMSMNSVAQFGSPFGGHQHSHSQHNASIGNKRARDEESHTEFQVHSATKHLQSIIASQSNEIQSLKSDKESLQASYQELSASHEKSQNENKVLKKVLAIKQERQDQFVSELEDARRYKEQADQLIAVLRQHLAAQQQSHGNSSGYNNFGGPPNVF